MLKGMRSFSENHKTRLLGERFAQRRITYTRQPDRTGADVEVHEIVNDSTLKVVLNAIDNDLFPNIHNFEVRVLVFVAVLVNGFVYLFIIAYAIEEILSRSFRILAAIIRARSLDIADVCHDDVLVVALALDKEDLDAMLSTNIVDPFSTFLGGISCI